MSFNTTVNSSSPLINYWPRSAWNEIPRPNDASGSQHITTSLPAALFFTWRGSGIWVYGRSENLSRVIVDGSDNETSFVGPAGNDSGLIFAASNLDPSSTHSLSLANNGGPDAPLIFDYLLFETSLGAGPPKISINLDDSPGSNSSSSGISPVNFKGA
ncbi:hypothetical protein HGRIS_010645 [Hohenbuehelia grisea]|uniref:Uncharacterized protein n=1 Tax=Hohenbuehelia grisea TaxID=104357 RepID=A0ABR3IXG0_9AGAR